MNVFLACFIAVIFARIVGGVAQHQFMRWYVAHMMRRQGAKIAREMEHAGIQPMIPGGFVIGTMQPSMFATGPGLPSPPPQPFEDNFQQRHDAMVTLIRRAARVGDFAIPVLRSTRPGVVLDLSIDNPGTDDAVHELIEACMDMRQIIPAAYLESAYGVPQSSAVPVAEQAPVSGEITCNCQGDHAPAARHLRSVGDDPKDAA